jgi:hypothetical protein
MAKLVIIPWYTAVQWAKLQALAEDQENMRLEHATWLHLAEQTIDLAKKQGADVTRYYVDVDDLAAWCAAEELPINAENRSRFAILEYQKKFQKK